MLRGEKGITLVILVITIIIMIILGGVAAKVAIDSGVIMSAKNAVDATNDKVEEQQNRVDELTSMLNEVLE